MDEREFAEIMTDILLENEDQDFHITTFADAGLLTNDEGIVVSLEDRSEFQVTIVKSR